MEAPMEAMLRSSGRLRKRFVPALYLDPFFFARYVEAAVPEPPAGGPPAAPAADRDSYALIVHRVRAGGPPHAVASALTVLRWMQEVAPRYRAADEAGRTVSTREESEFAGMRFQSWLNRYLGDALGGLLQVDLQGFSLTAESVWEEVPALAIVDADCRCALHALAARHFGCTLLATTQPEMVRICELLHASGGPRALLGPQAVLAALAG